MEPPPALDRLNRTDRDELYATLGRMIDDIDRQIEALRTEAAPFRETRGQLEELARRDLIAGLEPADLLTNRDQLVAVANTEWDYGRGNERLYAFIRAAFKQAAPEFLDFDRELTLGTSDYEVVAVAPALGLTRDQDVTDLVRTMHDLYPVLHHDGIVAVSVYTRGHDSHWALTMTSADSGHLEGSFGRRDGTMRELLAYIAREGWWNTAAV